MADLKQEEGLMKPGKESYTLLSETRPIARKDHRCIWCGQSIPKGSKYVAERSVFDGEMQNHHWHEECLANAREVNDECEWEFMPYSNERPELMEPPK